MTSSGRFRSSGSSTSSFHSCSSSCVERIPLRSMLWQLYSHSAASKWADISGSGYVEFHFPVRLDEFVAGMCAATFAERHPLRRPLASVSFVLGLTGLVGTPWVWAAYPNGGHYFDAIGLVRRYGFKPRSACSCWASAAKRTRAF